MAVLLQLVFGVPVCPNLWNAPLPLCVAHNLRLGLSRARFKAWWAASSLADPWCLRTSLQCFHSPLVRRLRTSSCFPFLGLRKFPAVIQVTLAFVELGIFHPKWFIDPVYVHYHDFRHILDSNLSCDLLLERVVFYATLVCDRLFESYFFMYYTMCQISMLKNRLSLR